MTHHLIRAGELHQGPPRMSWLPSRLPLAPVTLASQFSSWAITTRLRLVWLSLASCPSTSRKRTTMDSICWRREAFSARCEALSASLGCLGSLSCQFHFQLRDAFFCCHGPILTASAIPDLSSYSDILALARV